jgi:hypothetical protein
VANRRTWARGRRLLLAGLVALAPACKRETPPVLDARRLVPPPPADAASAPTRADAARAPATTTAEPQKPAVGDELAVEIAGLVSLPPATRPTGRLMVYISASDCLNDAVPLLRRQPVTDDGTFYVVVMARRGSQLSVCAAAETAPGQPARLYGRAQDPLRIGRDATTDLAFHDVQVLLRQDAPRRFSTQIAP